MFLLHENKTLSINTFFHHHYKIIIDNFDNTIVFLVNKEHFHCNKKSRSDL